MHQKKEINTCVSPFSMKPLTLRGDVLCKFLAGGVPPGFLKPLRGTRGGFPYKYGRGAGHTFQGSIFEDW